jgi:hypothetical protein
MRITVRKTNVQVIHHFSLYLGDNHACQSIWYLDLERNRHQGEKLTMLTSGDGVRKKPTELQARPLQEQEKKQRTHMIASRAVLRYFRGIAFWWGISWKGEDLGNLGHTGRKMFILLSSDLVILRYMKLDQKLDRNELADCIVICFLSAMDYQHQYRKRDPSDLSVTVKRTLSTHLPHQVNLVNFRLYIDQFQWMQGINLPHWIQTQNLLFQVSHNRMTNRRTVQVVSIVRKVWRQMRVWLTYQPDQIVRYALLQGLHMIHLVNLQVVFGKRVSS